VAKPAIALIQKMGIDSLRAEISWFEAARAYVAADARAEVTPDDLRVVAPMALRLRRSRFMSEYFNGQEGEEKEVALLLAKLGEKKRKDAGKQKSKKAKIPKG
jgi:magnesium chelatase subunit I